MVLRSRPYPVAFLCIDGLVAGEVEGRDLEELEGQFRTVFVSSSLRHRAAARLPTAAPPPTLTRSVRISSSSA